MNNLPKVAELPHIAVIANMVTLVKMATIALIDLMAEMCRVFYNAEAA